MSNSASGSRGLKQPVLRSALVRLFLLLAPMLSVVAVANGQSSMPERPVFDVPRVDGIKIDGKFDDWGDRGLVVHTMINDGGEYPDPKEFTGDFRLGWDDRGLLLAIRVHDVSWTEESSPTALFHGDSIELFVADAVGSMNYQQVYIAPGMAADQPKLRHHTIDYNLDARNGAMPTLEAERIAVTPHDYTMEVLYPWSNLGLKPHMGDKVGFEIYFNDAKVANSKIVGQRHLIFFPATLTYANPLRMHWIRLSDKASPPVLATGSGPEKPTPPVNLRVLYDPSLAGKTIELVDGDNVLGSASIPSGSEEGQFVPMTVAQPPMDKINHWFPLRVEGVGVGYYRLGDPDRAMNDAITNPTAKQSVFKQGGSIDGFADPPGLVGVGAVGLVKKPADPKAVSWALIIGVVGVVILIAASGYGIYRAKRLSPLDI